MREIEFRGKRKDTGEWVYGNGFFIDNAMVNTSYVYQNNWFKHREVIPETVGQYTGLKDKNGVKIFEGDIVAYCGAYFQTAIVCHGLYNTNGEHCAHSEHYGLFFRTIKIQGRKVLYPDTPVHCIDNKAAFWPSHCADSPLGIPQLLVEVIGNIHDNPELLEAEQTE